MTGTLARREALEDIVKGIGEIKTRRKGEVFADLKIPPHRMAMRLQKKGVTHLTAITAVDTGENIEIIYSFDHKGETLNLVHRVPKQKGAHRESVESIAPVYPVAELYEREIHDLFGTRFEGNPSSNKTIFLDETSTREPHRKKGG